MNHIKKHNIKQVQQTTIIFNTSLHNAFHKQHHTKRSIDTHIKIYVKYKI